MKTAELVDLSAVFFRYYFSPSPEVFNEEGYEVSALLSSVRWLCQSRFFQSDLTILAFDESLGTGFRHQLDEDYKANRPLPTQDIIYQLACLQEMAKLMGFVVLKSDVYEADDLIASSISHLQLASECDITIHSRDKDLRQLLNEFVRMLDVQTQKIWDVSSLWEDTGLTPNQIADYLALMGDNSDNIIGVPGVGDKTARALLKQFSNVDGILQAINNQQELPVRGAKRIASLVDEYQELIHHNLQLTTLVSDIDIHDAMAQRQPFNGESHLALQLLCDSLDLAEKLQKPLSALEEFAQ